MADAREIRLITFAVGPERFVFDIMAVLQIIPYQGSTAVPRAPEFVEGIIVLRSEVIPVIDLRSRLFPKLGAWEGEALLLVCETSYGRLGLKVDQVLRIVTVSTDEILAAPRLVHGLQGELFFGVIPRKDAVYLLLDLEALLSAEEQSQLVAADLDSAATDGEAVPR